MSREFILASSFCLGVCLVGSTAFGEVTENARKFLAAHCQECHEGKNAEANLDLTQLDFNPVELQNRERWIRIVDRVKSGEMPPEKPLSEPISQAFYLPISELLSNSIRETQNREGRTPLRRLNRREFENSLHDLLGITTPLQHLLPVDSSSQGFDTVAEGLRVSAVQIEKYFEAIDVALDAAIRLTELPKQVDGHFSLRDEKEIRENIDKPEGEVDPVSGNKHKQLFKELDDAVVYISHGWSPDNLRQFNPTADGVYRVRISAYGVHSRGEPITLRVFLSDYKIHRLVRYYEMLPDEPRVVEFSVPLTNREHIRINGHGIGIDANGKSVWNVDTIKDWEVPGLAVQWVEVAGPLFEEWPPVGLKKLVGAGNLRPLKTRGKWTPQGHIAFEIAADDPPGAARKIIEQFASRAFRRPLYDGEAERFVKLAEDQLGEGSTLEQALRVALRSILVSPQFLYLEENVGQLNDFALASRMSYFFWSAPPDDELLQLAAAKKLSQSDVRQTQVDRMLKSPRADAFVTSFLGQWLDLSQIDATTPDMRLYPEYDEMLRASIVQETETYFREMLEHDLSVAHVIDSKFLMLDRRMSLHYDIPLPVEPQTKLFGEEFRRVELPADSLRGGLLTQASLLKVTSNGTVTSPVLRGAWILRHILGTPPQPPPPVAAIEPDTRGATTIRQQLEQHRDVESCNRCHRMIDPPGFALESFDVIGGYRERYRSIGEGDRAGKKLFGRDIWEYKLGLPVDSSGQTSDGKAFTGIREFKKLLMDNQDLVLINLTKSLLTYGTGAGISFADRPEVDRIAAHVAERGSGIRTLIQEVVASELFRTK